ncbi:MAG: hypothetical protein QXK52_06455 [Candidatus Bathyarchaeia archaeon]
MGENWFVGFPPEKRVLKCREDILDLLWDENLSWSASAGRPRRLARIDWGEYRRRRMRRQEYRRGWFSRSSVRLMEVGSLSRGGGWGSSPKRWEPEPSSPPRRGGSTLSRGFMEG